MSSPISTSKAPEISIQIGTDYADGQNIYEKLAGWEGLSVEKSIDSAADGFAFSFPFDPESKNKDRFRPFGIQPVKVYADEQLLITGYIESVGATTGSNNRSLEIQGRSISSGLVDWSAGYKYNPNVAVKNVQTVFQFENVKFNDIAAAVSGPLDVKAVPNVGPFPDVAIEPGQSIYDFLSSLAAANGLWARTTPQGGLRFIKIEKSAPVVDLIEGTSPVLSVTTGHDVTKRYRGYIAIADADGSPEVSASAEDTQMPIGKRGIKIIQPNQKSADYTQAAQFARSRALISAYSVQVSVTGWTFNNRFWTPGDTVRVKAPGAFILKLSPFIIKRAAFKLDEAGGQITDLELTFPEAYNNRLPEVLPWVS